MSPHLPSLLGLHVIFIFRLKLQLKMTVHTLLASNSVHALLMLVANR